MLKPTDYCVDDVRFAYCYHVYFRWRTHRGRPSGHLNGLNRATADELVAKYDIRILECETDKDEVRLLVSLRPGDAVSVAEGKVKGQAAKWLRQQSGERFGRGYFACTAGKSTSEKLDDYLASQGEHHGYANRVPPVFVRSYAIGDDARLQSPHSVATLRFHFVLTTWRRRGVFGSRSAAAIANVWQSLEGEHRFALLKLSFVPDHVHVAIRVHPNVVPSQLAADLMNAAQSIVWRDFSGDAIQAGIERLWQPSSYIGSFGTLATPQVVSYVRRWRAAHLSS